MFGSNARNIIMIIEHWEPLLPEYEMDFLNEVFNNCLVGIVLILKN